MRLRDLLRERLSNWKEDLTPPWRAVIGSGDLNFERRAFDRKCLPGERIIPGSKGQHARNAPERAHMLRSLAGVEPNAVRAVILGQDPYPNPAWATGRAFEQGDRSQWPTRAGEIAPSLRRIVQVIAYARSRNRAYANGDRGWIQLVANLENNILRIERPPKFFDRLEQEGVLFLNTSFTVSITQSSAKTKPQSRHFRLWEPVLYRLLPFLVTRKNSHVVFLLWGEHASKVMERGGIVSAAKEAGTWKSSVDIVRNAHPAAITSKGAAFLRPPNPFLSANNALERMGAEPMRGERESRRQNETSA